MYPRTTKSVLTFPAIRSSTALCVFIQAPRKALIFQVLHVKASILSGRVARFQRRWRDRKLRPNDDFEGTQRAEFKQLDSAISCFLCVICYRLVFADALRMSIPASLKNPLAKTCSSGKSGLDSDLLVRSRDCYRRTSADI